MSRPIIERFLDKVKFDTKKGCWLWTGGLAGKGYALLFVSKTPKRINIYGHVFAYTFFRDSIPEGMELDHKCRNPRCVNPFHVEPVTHRENVLKGETIAARNASKTHCLRGHLYQGDNLRINSSGHRQCRACDKFYHDKHKAKLNQQSH